MRLSIQGSAVTKGECALEGLSVKIGRRYWSVESIEDASAWFCAVRDRFGEGASNTPTPILCRDGEAFGYISYNGRVWSGSPKEWKSGDVPLFDPINLPTVSFNGNTYHVRQLISYEDGGHKINVYNCGASASGFENWIYEVDGRKLGLTGCEEAAREYAAQWIAGTAAEQRNRGTRH